MSYLDWAAGVDLEPEYAPASPPADPGAELLAQWREDAAVKRHLAVHEAGHAIAFRATDLGDPEHVRFERRSGSVKPSFDSTRRHGRSDHDHTMAHAIATLAGEAAVKAAGAPAFDPSDSDLGQARDLVAHLEYPAIAYAEAERRARDLMAANVAAIESLAASLIGADGKLEGPAVTDALDWALDGRVWSRKEAAYHAMLEERYAIQRKAGHPLPGDPGPRTETRGMSSSTDWYIEKRAQRHRVPIEVEAASMGFDVPAAKRRIAERLGRDLRPGTRLRTFDQYLDDTAMTKDEELLLEEYFVHKSLSGSGLEKCVHGMIARKRSTACWDCQRSRAVA